MRNIRVFYLFSLLLSIGGVLYAQDSLPRIIIGDIRVYTSVDSIVGESIQGHVSYDVSTNTLFLNNATIDSYLRACRTEGCFKVKLSGNNSITRMVSNNDSCIFFGPGILNLGESTVWIAFDCAHTDYLALTEGATLNITASETGIYTLYDHLMDPDTVIHYPALVIDNSSLIITAPQCCEYIWAWWLSGCRVVAPEDFEYQLDTWNYLPSGRIQDYLEVRVGTAGQPSHETVAWRAWSVNGGIRIDGLPDGQTIEVLNILGQTVHHSIVSSPNTFIPLKTGMFLVRVNNHTVKTIVN